MEDLGHLDAAQPGSLAPAPSAPEVAVRQVGFAYGERPGSLEPGADAVWTLDRLDLEIRRGDFVVIVGPSGCGKTTLLSLISGMLEPTTGSVQVGGTRPADHHARMGYMPARHGLLPWRSALGNVAVPLEGGRSPLSATQRSERARDQLLRVGLEGFEDFHPHELSQGMRQRVSLARALVNDPEILLMDEPFGALDAQTKLRVQDGFLKTWEGSGRTVVFITHDLQEAVLLADRVIVMGGRPGRVVYDRRVGLERPRAGSLQELQAGQTFREMYRELAESVAGSVDWDGQASAGDRR